MLAVQDQAAGAAGLVADRGERAGQLPPAGARATAQRAARPRAASSSAGRRGSRRRHRRRSFAERLRRRRDRHGGRSASAVAGAVPPYAIPAVAIDHLPAEIGIRTGVWRSGAHSYTAFFTESFIDELARQAEDRAACPSGCRCSATIRGSRAACRPRRRWAAGTAACAEARWGSPPTAPSDRTSPPWSRSRSSRSQRVRVLTGGRARSIAGGSSIPTSSAADRGRASSSGLPPRPAVRSASRADGPTRAASASLGLPTLADSPEVTVELSGERGAAGRRRPSSACRRVAPAIANALFALTGRPAAVAAARRRSGAMNRPADHPPMPAPKVGVLLINLGTPDRPSRERSASI